MVDIVRPRFELGRIVATPAALDAIQVSRQSPAEFLDRHVRGDWGDVSDDDGRLNDEALQDGSRLLSAYITNSREKIWVITEAVSVHGRRPSTTILLPREY